MSRQSDKRKAKRASRSVLLLEVWVMTVDDGVSGWHIVHTTRDDGGRYRAHIVSIPPNDAPARVEPQLMASPPLASEAEAVAEANATVGRMRKIIERILAGVGDDRVALKVEHFKVQEDQAAFINAISGRPWAHFVGLAPTGTMQ